MSTQKFSTPMTAPQWTRTTENAQHIEDWANGPEEILTSPGGIKRPSIAALENILRNQNLKPVVDSIDRMTGELEKASDQVQTSVAKAEASSAAARVAASGSHSAKDALLVDGRYTSVADGLASGKALFTVVTGDGFTAYRNASGSAEKIATALENEGETPYIDANVLSALSWSNVAAGQARIVKKAAETDGLIDQIQYYPVGSSGDSFGFDVSVLEAESDGFRCVDMIRVTNVDHNNEFPGKRYLVSPTPNQVNTVDVALPIMKGQYISFQPFFVGTFPGHPIDSDASPYPSVLLSSGSGGVRYGQKILSSDFSDTYSVYGIKFRKTRSLSEGANPQLGRQQLGMYERLPFIRYSDHSLSERYRIYNDPAVRSGIISSVTFMSGAGSTNNLDDRTNDDYLIGFFVGIFKQGASDTEVVLDRFYTIRNDSKDSLDPLRSIPQNTFQTIDLDIPIVAGEYVGLRPFSNSFMQLNDGLHYENLNGHTYIPDSIKYPGSHATITPDNRNQASVGVGVVLSYNDDDSAARANLTAARDELRRNHLLQAPFDVETRYSKVLLGHDCQDGTVIGDKILIGHDDTCYLHDVHTKELLRSVSHDLGHMGNLDYSPIHDYLSSVPLQSENDYISEGRQKIIFIKNWSDHIDDSSYAVANLETISVYLDDGNGNGVFDLDDSSAYRLYYPHFVFDNAQPGVGFVFLTGSYYQQLVVAKISLGLGSNDFSQYGGGFGEYIDGVGENDFNGTCFLLGKWRSRSTGSFQGGCVYAGKFYISWSRPSAFDGDKSEPSAYRRNELIRFAFGDDGTMVVDKKYTSQEIDSDGREKSIEVESAYTDGRYIYNHSSQGAQYAYPIDYTTPMGGIGTIGSDGTVAVDFPFRCNATPAVMLTSTNADAVGAYVSAVDASGFTVAGAAGGTFNWTAAIS